MASLTALSFQDQLHDVIFDPFLVSLDNFATPVVCILSGYLQQALGPKIVRNSKNTFVYKFF